jgi:hypothetical protein
MALCNGEIERTRMLNARHRFALLWQRLVAALSLVVAAALTPAAVSAPAGGAGAGAIGSGMGNGAAVASAAGAVAGNVAALIEGGQQRLPLDTSPDGTKAKARAVAARQETTLPDLAAARPLRAARAVLPSHAARSGHARAPPLA